MSSQLKAGHGKKGRAGGEGGSREKERAACNLRGEESSFLSFRQHRGLPPRPHPAFALSPLLVVAAAAGIAVPVAVPSAVAATGCSRPFAREIVVVPS